MNVLLIRLLFRHDSILKYYLYLNERKIAIFGPIFNVIAIGISKLDSLKPVYYTLHVHSV